jgi:hypothetical protein
MNNNGNISDDSSSYNEEDLTLMNASIEVYNTKQKSVI